MFWGTVSFAVGPATHISPLRAGNCPDSTLSLGSCSVDNIVIGLNVTLGGTSQLESLEADVKLADKQAGSGT